MGLGLACPLAGEAYLVAGWGVEVGGGPARRDAARGGCARAAITAVWGGAAAGRGWVAVGGWGSACGVGGGGLIAAGKGSPFLFGGGGLFIPPVPPLPA